jgi:hypothetical protein
VTLFVVLTTCVCAFFCFIAENYIVSVAGPPPRPPRRAVRARTALRGPSGLRTRPARRRVHLSEIPHTDARTLTGPSEKERAPGVVWSHVWSAVVGTRVRGHLGGPAPRPASRRPAVPPRRCTRTNAIVNREARHAPTSRNGRSRRRSIATSAGPVPISSLSRMSVELLVVAGLSPLGLSLSWAVADLTERSVRCSARAASSARVALALLAAALGSTK